MARTSRPGGARVETQSLRQQDFNVPGQGLIINFIHHWFPSLLRRDRTPDELENWIGRFQLLKGSLWLMVQYFRLLVEVGYNSVCVYIQIYICYNIYRFVYAIIYICMYIYIHAHIYICITAVYIYTDVYIYIMDGWLVDNSMNHHYESLLTDINLINYY